ncbi:membrane metallo-endopeptidase-like 1 [Drosophila ficusphila]|uniref:membrane metallo-endopeptidase-like 1 n=1 Tax=Drosophila ficusphila TaxID=30025 RepID=UPI001C88E539|nr:membrane metallo-endopeptidase-like 1 [Drosophila ficusphila]
MYHIVDNWLTSFDFCDNFYLAACGTYASHHANGSYHNLHEMLVHQMHTKLMQVMEELQQSSQTSNFDQSSVEAKVLRYYRSCRESPPETREIKHFLRLAPPAEGLPWPLLANPGTLWPADQFNWMDTVAELHKYGLDSLLINVQFGANSLISTERIFRLRKPKTVQINYKKATRALRALRMPSEGIDNLLRRIRKLEWDVNNLTVPWVYPKAGIMTVDQMERRTGYKWQEFIGKIVGHRIQANFRVAPADLTYLTALKKLIDSTDTELLAHYMMIRFILHLQWETPGSDDPLECAIAVRSNMYLASNLLFEKRFLPNLSLYTRQIKKIFEEIRQQLLLKIERNRLNLTAEQKDMIYRKVQSVVLNLGNMPEGMDHRRFADEHYDDLDIPWTDLDFARDHLKLLEFRTRKGMAAKESYKKYDILSYLPESFAPLYAEQIIMVPYEYLQEPFFLPDSHDVFKFSLMGVLLGHELMHSVDTQGVTFDDNGNANELGLQIAYSPGFQSAVDRLGLRIFSPTVGERIADVGAVDLAYSAYFAKSRSRIRFTRLSHEKVFFLNMAQRFCTDGLRFKYEVHDDLQVRLAISLMGNARFDAAFKCKQRQNPFQLW